MSGSASERIRTARRAWLRLAWLPAAALIVGACSDDGPAGVGPGGVVYANDFSGAAGAEWSSREVATSPSGERFLGELEATTVALALADLPPHSGIEITLDLYVLMSMDGNGDPSTGTTPDPFTFALDGAVLKRTSFSNVYHQGQSPAIPQAYPGDHPDDSHPPGTGAAGFDTLGYEPRDGRWWGDTTYRLTFTAPHSAPTAVFAITAAGLSPMPNEGWGLDNVTITVK